MYIIQTTGSVCTLHICCTHVFHTKITCQQDCSNVLDVSNFKQTPAAVVIKVKVKTVDIEVTDKYISTYVNM